MLKPDTVNRGFIGEIITRLEKKGLQILAIKMLFVPLKKAEELYKQHIGKAFYAALYGFTVSSPVVVMVISGLDSINIVRTMIGSVDQIGTIRGDYSVTKSNRNLIHASDSVAAASREIGIFFEQNEICKYPKQDAMWVYSSLDLVEE